MKCEELLEVLNDYVDGHISLRLCEQLSEHLAGCDPCRIVVDNIRGTLALYRGTQPYSLPPELHERLNCVLRQKWKIQVQPDLKDS